LAAEAGPSYVNTHQLDLRALAEAKSDAFSWAAHAEYLGSGSNARLDRFESYGLYSARLQQGLPNDDRRLLPLTTKVQSESHYRSVLRLDRAYCNYASGMLALRAGRQAVSWGNGLVFQALDVFNPFSPTEIDKDYKSGDDMLWGQVLFDSGSDLQALIVPRRHPVTESVLSSESSYALRLRGRIERAEADYELIAASHYDETALGAGVSRSVEEAVIRADVFVADLDGSRSRTSWLINVDRSWVVFGLNIYTFGEFFRNGFGVAGKDYATPSEALLNRLGRGEVYTLGRDYLAVGGFVEISALQKTNLSSFFNLHDESAVLQARHEYELAQNLLLMLGTNFYVGPRGSEFGGVVVPNSNLFLSSGQSVYLRLSAFF
jgi:hypothetical protein